MLSFKRPKVPKPKIPKMKKSDTSKRKKLDKSIKSEISTKKTQSKPEKKKVSLPKPKTTHTKKKTHMKHGTCYSEKNCKGKILSKQCTKSECKKMGGKSWKGTNDCESLQ